MSADAIQIVQLLEARIFAMNEMADSLAASSAAIAACNIDGLEDCIRKQEALCASIQSMDKKLEEMQSRQRSRDRMSAVNEKETESLRNAITRLKDVHQRVKVLNQSHAELLRRSRRTVLALSRAYQTVSADLYPNPTQQFSSVGERV